MWVPPTCSKPTSRSAGREIHGHRAHHRRVSTHRARYDAAQARLVRVEPGAGAPIVGELFRVSAAGLGTFLAGLPAPMALTATDLDDGRTVVGFTATHDATGAGKDVTEFGGWVAYLDSLV